MAQVILDTGVKGVDFVVTIGEHNDYFFALMKDGQTLHLTVALQQWVRDRAKEWAKTKETK